MSPLPIPERGSVIFHRACLPALLADDYELRVDHDLGVDTSARPLPGERRFGLRVDGPRFTMESSLIHGVFPPTNGRGSYITRLPQIVLRRRTLPWERVLPGTPDTPWMALLLFEDGEATTISPCTVGEVLDGTGLVQHAPLAIGALDSVSRAQPCTAIDVPMPLFKEIAPLASEISLLCHVRQVNTEDKELLGMDEDGWFAVVVGNRLPEPGKKYLACLVSLEGAQAYLPTAAEAAPLTGSDLGGGIRDFGAHAEELMKHAVIAAPGITREDVTGALVEEMVRADSKYAPLKDETSSSVSGKVASATATRWTDLKVSDGFTSVLFTPPTLRLFSLAQWSFECLDGGDFEAIMQALPTKGGVSMLGMPPETSQAPDSSGASEWRAALDTGHVPLEHLTREGEQTIAWYRGPLTPVGVTRSNEGPFHTSDQARRVDPETGLENLGYSAAFEIGRLLALGDPRFALDLLRWRRGDRMQPDARITFEIVNRFAASLARDLRFEPKILFKLPTALAAVGATKVRDVISRDGMGRAMDPTGLAGLEAKLPGLAPDAIASALGVDMQVVSGILGGVTVGSATLLDKLEIGTPLRVEADIEVLSTNPDAQFGQLNDVFDARMSNPTGPNR
ncbi:MAG: hypothetical protein ABI681_06700 [Gemmatimonadales bacterium]